MTAVEAAVSSPSATTTGRPERGIAAVAIRASDGLLGAIAPTVEGSRTDMQPLSASASR